MTSTLTVHGMCCNILSRIDARLRGFKSDQHADVCDNALRELLRDIRGMSHVHGDTIIGLIDDAIYAVNRFSSPLAKSTLRIVRATLENVLTVLSNSENA